MSRLVPLLLLGLSIALADPSIWRGRLVRVIDGDTVVMSRNGEEVRVRLHGIDTPERRQPYGPEATEALRRIIGRDSLRVVVMDIDRYGRTVGRLWKGDTVDVSATMVCNGSAWWYRRYAKADSLLSMCERAARTDRLGLWNQSNPVPPWNWRRK